MSHLGVGRHSISKLLRKRGTALDFKGNFLGVHGDRIRGKPCDVYTLCVWIPANVLLLCLHACGCSVRADITKILVSNLRYTTGVVSNGCKLQFFYNHFGTNFRTLWSFFWTLDTKLKTVITCNTGCPMLKTLHCAFISLKKPCTCRIIGSNNLFIMKYHRNIHLDHPHTRYR